MCSVLTSRRVWIMATATQKAPKIAMLAPMAPRVVPPPPICSHSMSRTPEKPMATASQRAGPTRSFSQIPASTTMMSGPV